MEEFKQAITALNIEVDALRASNELLIAELGRIAHALGVEPSMAAVLTKISELKEKP